MNTLARMNRLSTYVGAWIKLASALVVIFSFGMLDPCLDMRFARWRIDTRRRASASGRSRTCTGQ